MAVSEEVVVKIQADIAALKRDMRAASTSVDQFGDHAERSGSRADQAMRRAGAGATAMKVAIVAALASVAALSAVTFKAAGAAIDLERQQARLGALLKATGHAAGFNKDQLVDMARQIDITTLQSKRGALDAIGVLLTFTNIQGAQFRQTLALSADLAEVMGGDLKGAALQLAKALEDPATGLTMLRRVGVSFEEQLKDQIIALQKAGRLQEAQGMILKRVSEQVGGAAKGAADTTAGAVDAMAMAWREFKEEVGKQALPFVKDAVKEIIAVLRDPEVIAGVKAMAKAIVDALQTVVNIIAAVARGFGRLRTLRQRALSLANKNDLTAGVVTHNPDWIRYVAEARRTGVPESGIEETLRFHRIADPKKIIARLRERRQEMRAGEFQSVWNEADENAYRRRLRTQYGGDIALRRGNQTAGGGTSPRAAGGRGGRGKSEWDREIEAAARDAAARAKAVNDLNAGLERQIELEKARTATLGLGRVEREAQLATIQQVHSMEQRGISLTEQEIAKLYERNRALAEARIANEEQRESIETLRQTVENAASQAFGGLIDALFEGKNAGEAFRNTMKNIARQIAETAFQALVLKPLMDSLFKGGGGGMGGGGGWIGLIASVAGGMLSRRAGGGPINPSVPTLVGERGPEILAKGTGGRIVPASRLDQAKGGTTIYADLRGASSEAVARLHAMVMDLDANLEPRAVGAMYNERIRGGSVAAAFGAVG